MLHTKSIIGILLLGGAIFAGTSLLTEPPQANGQGASTSITGPKPRTEIIENEFPDDWYFYGGGRPVPFRRMEGKAAPKLQVSEWYGEEFDLKSTKGKVVVVDFWGTWCGPCVKAIPENIELVKKYKDKGLVIIGMHDAKRGWNRLPALAGRLNFNYPLAKDNGQSERDWKVRFWPTYGVIDRSGILRAIGLVPHRVDDVVEKLLKEKAPVAADNADDKDLAAITEAPLTREYKEEAIFKAMLEGTPAQRESLRSVMTLAKPPSLETTEWLNSPPLNLDQLKGKVVVLDFWATWCAPCIKSIPKTNALQAKYADDGLVIIGVCHPQDVNKMKSVAQEHSIAYPLCADREGTITAAYRVNSWPDYYLIDRAGNLRIADCSNNKLEDAIKILLAEEAIAP